MLLVVSIPDTPIFSPATTVSWSLLDARNALLRSGNTRLGETPQADRVLAAVPCGRIAFVETALPKVRASKRGQLLQYAIEDKLTGDPAGIHTVLLGQAGNAGTVPSRWLVAAIDKTWLRAVCSWLTSEGRSARIAVPETDALLIPADEWAVLLRPQGGYARRADGYAFALDDTSTFSPPLALTLAVQEASPRPRRILLLREEAETGSAEDAKRCEHWSTALGLEVASAAPMPSTLAHQRLAQDQRHNLLSGEFAPTSVRAGAATMLRPVLLAICVLVTLQLAFTLTDWWRLARERATVQAEMTALFKATFPEATAIVDPALQLQRNLADLQRARGVPTPDPALRLLSRAAAVCHGLAGLRVVGVKLQGGTLSVDARVPTSAATSMLTTLRARAQRDRGAVVVMGEALDADTRIELTFREAG